MSDIQRAALGLIRKGLRLPKNFHCYRDQSTYLSIYGPYLRNSQPQLVCLFNVYCTTEGVDLVLYAKELDKLTNKLSVVLYPYSEPTFPASLVKIANKLMRAWLAQGLSYAR